MSGKTPPNALLSRIRSRRSAKGYLWLVYSHKARSDLILESNRELAHWLLNIEFNVAAVEFWIPTQSELYGDQCGGRKTRPDVIVRNSDGVLEWHEIKAGHLGQADISLQIATQRELSADSGVLHKLFDDSSRTAREYELMPRLRLMHFIAIGRGQPIVAHAQKSISEYLMEQGAGTIGELLKAFPTLNPTGVVSALVRTAIEGAIEVDVNVSTPTLHTAWTLRGAK